MPQSSRYVGVGWAGGGQPLAQIAARFLENFREEPGLFFDRKRRQFVRRRGILVFRHHADKIVAALAAAHTQNGEHALDAFGRIIRPGGEHGRPCRP